MGNSLQDQLLKAGLATAKQAKKAKAGQVPKKKKKGQAPELSDSARAAQQAMADKAARDRALNESRKQEQAGRAVQAQVRQLIEQHRLSREDAEHAFHFQDGTKVKTLHVTPAILALLEKDRVEIVRQGETYEVVPSDVAAKIRERCDDCVIERNATASTVAEDDPYKDFPVPDDLMW